MAAKAAAAHLMRNVALELAKYNILVNAIAPGPFITNIGGGHAHTPEVQAGFCASGAASPHGFDGRDERLGSVSGFAGLELHHRLANRHRWRHAGRRCRLGR